MYELKLYLMKRKDRPDLCLAAPSNYVALSMANTLLNARFGFMLTEDGQHPEQIIDADTDETGILVLVS